MYRKPSFERGVSMMLAMGAMTIACVDNQAASGTSVGDNQPGIFAGGESNTHSHMGDLGEGLSRNPFDILAQRQEEGPPEVRTRLHSCQKLQKAAITNMLESLGVNLAATGDPPTAGQLLAAGGSALGTANYDARVGEASVWTNAGAAKLFDIFVQAAPEIIANLPNVAQCKSNGLGPVMFDAQNHCNPAAITCVTGRPTTSDEVAACSAVVGKASDIDKGKRIAVAALMAAAHSCE